MQEPDAVTVALEGDVAAVLGDRRAHPRLEQLLDGPDRLLILWRELFVSLSGFGPGGHALGHGFAREIMLHDGAEDGGLEMLPLAFALGHTDEVRAEEHAGHAVDLEQAGGERRALALGGGAGNPWSLPRTPPRSRGISWGPGCGGRFGLNKHHISLRCLTRERDKSRRVRLEWF